MNVAVVPVLIGRVEGCAASHADDLLAVEEALEIRLGNRSLTIFAHRSGEPRLGHVTECASLVPPDRQMPVVKEQLAEQNHLLRCVERLMLHSRQGLVLNWWISLSGIECKDAARPGSRFFKRLRVSL